MKKSSIWGATLLGIVLLLGAGSLAARTGKTLVPNQVSSAVQLISVPSAVPWTVQTAVLATLPAIYTGGGDGDGNNDNGKDGDNDDHDHDHDHDHHHNDHAPTPEPSTLLSFGAAILIGGGVLLSRRLRRSK